ncbi:MAG TPA: hypothetical protein VHN99_06380, partial [Deinococcales bacterium]|nr:hypothetical protein [Deinococcales bacterium]
DLTPDEEDYFGAFLAERVAPFADLTGREGLKDLGTRALYLVAGSPTAPEPDYVIRVPTVAGRLMTVPGRKGGFVRLEALIQSRPDLFFPEPLPAFALRLTRQADLDLGEDLDWEELAHALEARLDGTPVRLEVESRFPWIEAARVATGVLPDEVMELDAPLDHRFLFTLAEQPRPELRFPAVKRRLARGFVADPFAAMRRHDVLLYHPLDDYQSVSRLLSAAAADPAVDRVRMTMYRIGRGNELAASLLDAAEAGKDVAVYLEGRARFDELDNLYWKLRFQAAGVKLLPYSPLKVHAKAVYVRRGGREYAHLGTGNYNPTNGGLYTDLSLFTANPVVTADVAEFFRALEEERLPRMNVLRFGPQARHELIGRIAREANPKGHIIIKLNHLTDERILEALRDAAQAGAKVDLIIRSSLTLLSDRFRARSLIGRFLEHARVAAFRAGGEWEVWAGSADWMPRNFERRIELVFPILNPEARGKVLRLLKAQLRDDANAFTLKADGSSQPHWGGKRNAQLLTL